MTRTLAAALAALALAGCTAAPTPRRTVLVLESALTTVDTAALSYTTLPACMPGGPRACSDPAVKARIKVAAQRAHDAVVAAQDRVDADPAGASDALRDAQAAIAALNSVVDGLPASGR
jgi:hypothetical protein